MIVAEVKMWKTRIGVVSIDENTPYVSFKYDLDFLRSGIEVSPITMPLSNVIYQFNTLPLKTFSGLPGLLSDSLPDRYGDAIIDAWLIANGRTRESFNIIERLCYIGIRGMGALEFYPNKSDERSNSEEIEVNHLIELSNKILNHKNDVTAKDKDELDQIIKVGTSAGGARAKAIIAYNEKTGSIKSGQIDAGQGYTYWIMKLDGVDQKEETSFTRIEYAYYLMALEAKIFMSESILKKMDGYYHFMTKRFDRVTLPDGSNDKVHMQTLGALMHIDYNEPGIISYEEVTHTMYKLGLKRSEIEQFFRRMVFNVMARNQDDHVKNISFIMNRRGQWALSPAYDITYSYNPKGKWTSTHQMLINGKKSNIVLADLLKSAHSMNIQEDRALIIINDVTKALQKWEEFAKIANIEYQTIKIIEKEFIFFKL